MTHALATQFDRALCDLDGVAFHGTKSINSAITGIRRARELGLEFHFVTNNASRDQLQVADKLTSLHIPTAPHEVTTAAMAIVELMKKDVAPGQRVYMVGGDGLRSALLDAGYTLTTSAESNPVAVVQGMDARVGWKQLSEAAYAIRQGATYYASNIDSTLPTERGLALGNGAMVAAVVAATGVEPITAGKPAPTIFTQAVGDARRPVVIGDRLNTDIAGGVAADIPTIHVLTGISQAHDVVRARPEERPDYLLVNLNELAQPYAAPTTLSMQALSAALGHDFTHGTVLSAATCADDIAIVSDQGLYYQPGSPAGGGLSQVTDDTRLPVTAYRAVVTAMWQAGPQAAQTCPTFTVVAP
ncbi:MAG: HAD-IIA family hydrolase [Bowdeniella nasicola]|nr:HAD-IIA family hydrolase [Bowdeniella nasicola]